MKKHKKAFTIIEFLLAMTVLSVMLMGIVTLTMRILEIYRKGLALRAINATGRDILNDLSRSVGGSPIVDNINPVPSSGSNDIRWNDIKKVYRNYYNEKISSSSVTNNKKVQIGGVFCTGSYSYVWNTAPAIEQYRKNPNNKNNLFTIEGKVYKLARFPDTDRVACERVNANSDALKTTHITNDIDSRDIVSLISDDESDLALYDFVVLPATQNAKTGQIFYSGSFILATMRGGVNVLTNGDYCTGTEQMYNSEVEAVDQDFNYCAVNKFNFAVRATGETSSVDQYGER